MKVGDAFYRDPFVRPLELKADRSSRLVDLATELIPVEKRRAHILFCTPATERCSVIGAKETANACTYCGGAVWLSPSSRDYLVDHPDAVTMICINHVLDRL